MTGQLPWEVQYAQERWINEFRWLVLDCWGSVIGQFELEEQARTAVKAVNGAGQ